MNFFKGRVGLLFALAALLIAILSMGTGTSSLYVLAQFVALLGFAALVQLAAELPLAVALILLATFAKNFVISQFVKLLFWQPADVGLSAPVETAWVVAVGVWASVIVAGAYRLIRPSARARTFLSSEVPRETLLMAGGALTILGLVSKALALGNPQASVIFIYFGDLTYAGAAAFAYETWRSSGKQRILDWRVLAIVGAALALSLQTGSKFTILFPFVFLGALYACFGKLPRWQYAAAGVIAFATVASVIHPVVNYARAGAGSTIGNVLTVLEDIAADPSRFSDVVAESDQMESRWTSRLYYGRPVGILGRFTPNQIGDLVAIAPYTRLNFGTYVSESFRALLPQSFGFQRTQNVGQSDLESAIQRKRVVGLNSSNYGLLASFYLYGGLAIVAFGMAAVTGLMLAIYTLGFGGQRNDIWALPYGVGGLFWLADQGLPGTLISLIHGAIIEWGGLTILLLLLRFVTRAAGPTELRVTSGEFGNT